MPEESLARTSHRPVFEHCAVATHMPFFDGSTLVFCQSGPPVIKNIPALHDIPRIIRRNPDAAERFKNVPRSHDVRYRAWKLAYCHWDDRKIKPIATGLPEDGIECSPAFYHEGGAVHLSFIAGRPTERGLRYHLYTASGPDLDHLEPAQPRPEIPLAFGFVSPFHLCWGVGNTLQITEKATALTFKLATNFARILRVTFLAEHPSRLLVTGVDEKFAERTILHDLSNGEVMGLTAEGEEVYKASLYGDRLIHARKGDQGLEDRVLCHSGHAFTKSAIEFQKIH